MVFLCSEVLMCYNGIISFSVLVTELHSQGFGVEFTLSGLALWRLMLKGLSWSFFKAPATQMLRSSCSGCGKTSVGILEKASTVKDEISAHLWHSSFKRQSTYHKNGKAGWCPEGAKPHLCVMEMYLAEEVLKNKCSSFEWVTRGAWSGREQAEQTVLSTHTDTSPGCSSKIQQFMAQEITLFFFLVMQMGFLFHEFVQSLLDVNFQHPQHPLGKSYSLCVLWKIKKNLSFELASC